MWVQPKLRTQTESDFANFTDHSASRPVIAGTVARGQARDDQPYYTGRDNGKYVTDVPLEHAYADMKLTSNDFKKFLQRGQERFTIYCTPCHGQLGDGKGMIAQRGLALRRQPASYHTDRLRKMPIGHFFDVMTNGYGAMYSYASRVEVQDRWAIAAYIRVLQMSQNQKVSDLPPNVQQSLVPEPKDTEQGQQNP
jgi:mono/diheme cytochrome c family protein